MNFLFYQKQKTQTVAFYLFEQVKIEESKRTVVLNILILCFFVPSFVKEGKAQIDIKLGGI